MRNTFNHDNNELYHWKYIKREKVSGKWVYTYPEDLLGLKKKTKEIVSNVSSKAKSAINAFSNKTKKTTNNLSSSKKLIQNTISKTKSSISNSAKTAANKALKQLSNIPVSQLTKKNAKIGFHKEYVENMALSALLLNPVAFIENTVGLVKDIIHDVRVVKENSKFKKERAKNEAKGQKYKFENEYTDKEIIHSLELSKNKKSLMKLYNVSTDEELIEKLKRFSYPGETLSDTVERLGLIDETMPGYHPQSFNDLNKIDKSVVMSDDEQMEAVNHSSLYRRGEVDVSNDGYPDYTAEGDRLPINAIYGYSNNCAYCSLAYEMRKRGYDVEASSVFQKTQNTKSIVESWYKGGKVTNVKKSSSRLTTSDIKNQILKKSPSGTRGTINLYWTSGGGHSLVYEVKGNDIIIRDCQTNKTYNIDRLPISRISSAQFMRTDNLEFTNAALNGVKNKER